MNWMIPNIDPFVEYFFKEAARWIAENAVTILLLTNLLTALQKYAIKLETIKDNRTMSLIGYGMYNLTKFLLFIVTGKWITQFRAPVQLDNNKPEIPHTHIRKGNLKEENKEILQ